jgi:hypothetical protein
LLLVVIAALIFMPVIGRPRWPAWPRTELSTIPTSLRLQFNAPGTTPQEIEKRNIEWTAFSYIEKRKKETSRKYVCEPDKAPSPSPNILGGVTLGGSLSTPCSYQDFTNYDDIKHWIIFLAFAEQIAATNIKLNTHGATLPKWDQSLTQGLGTIHFYGDLTRIILDVEVAN